MSLPNLKKKEASGFTLVEMAIVLVIIGIILAGVMKGRDIVRGAQVKQFSQGYAQKWLTVASTYYDKVGQQLADGEDNGGDTGISPDGRMDGVFPVADGAEAAIHDALNDVGITPCTMIKSDLEDLTGICNTGASYNIYERMVEGEQSGKARVTVGFFCFGNGTWIRNAVIIRNVPTDVAVGLDTLIDGQADGENGSCINIGGTGETVNTVADGLTSGNANEGYDASGEIAPWPIMSNAEGTTTTVALILDY